MDFVIRPTLQYISLAKITVELWIQNDYLMFKNEFKDELEAKVFIQVQSLPLPNLLKEEVGHFIKPIGLQIFEWFAYLNKFYHSVKINPKTICWNTCGTINKTKSVKVLLTDQILNLEMRYRLACGHCLVDEIQSFWEKMTEKEKLLQEKWCNSDNLTDHFLVQQYWNNLFLGRPLNMQNWIRRDNNRNLSPNFYGCDRAMASYNSTATQYFFGKLSTDEKKLLLFDVRYVLKHCRSYTTETVRFLFSQMNKNHRAEMLIRFPIIVLTCLLVWPYQCFFLETAKQTWRFLDICDFEELLVRIIDKMVICGCEYRAIFLEFWRSSPNKLKRCVTELNFFPWQQFYDCLKKGEDVFKMNIKERCWQLSIGNMTFILTIISAFNMEIFSIVESQ